MVLPSANRAHIIDVSEEGRHMYGTTETPVGSTHVLKMVTSAAIDSVKRQLKFIETLQVDSERREPA